MCHVYSFVYILLWVFLDGKIKGPDGKDTNKNVYINIKGMKEWFYHLITYMTIHETEKENCHIGP